MMFPLVAVLYIAIFYADARHAWSLTILRDVFLPTELCTTKNMIITKYFVRSGVYKVRKRSRAYAVF